MSQKNKAKLKGLVLVVGDWVIDEYWMLVRHHSRISSHTGFIHYRVSSQPNDPMSDLCGAGHVARILAQTLDLEKEFELVGIGNWNKDDRDYLLHLLHSRNNPNCLANRALFRQQRSLCDDPPPVSLYTLTPNGATTRVIRQYHRQPTGPKQINRVDWELRRVKDQDDESLPIASLDLPDGTGREVIIAVSDHRKGLVTEKLVADLSKKYKSAIWCVRTKDPKKTKGWVQKIDNLALYIVGPEVAAKLNPWDTWIANRRITIQALETIKDIPGENALLISHKHEIVGRLGQRKCLVAQSTTESDDASSLGWSAALLAALVEMVARKGASFGSTSIKKAVIKADIEAGLPLTRDIVLEDPVVETSDWEIENEDWGDARQGLGFLTRNGETVLDVWRGTALLPGYVACVKEKEEIVRRIGAKLRAFKNDSRRLSSLSILLHADPGAGKTTLVKSLAKAFGYNFKSFDITQIIHREGLLELLDAVATHQANVHEDLIVFVDEINTEVDSAHVYSSFLMPLEEGYYVRSGSAFALRPCVWIFAGTDPERGGLKKSEKYSDFETRMSSVEYLDFGSLERAYKNNTDQLQNEARLEQVYLGAVFIHHFFPDVTRVSKTVLGQFHKLNPATSPARRIRKMCETLRDVQYGMISRRNCEDWTEAIWGDEKKEWVKLVF